jgi:dihydroorotase
MRAEPADLYVRGARSYPPGRDAQRLEVLVRRGRIAAVGPDLAGEAGGAPRLDAEGLTLIPGLIDVHVHFRDPGLAHKEGWEHGSLGALHGGVTAVVEVQNNPPLSTTRAALLARLEHVGQRSRVDFGCLANLTPESVPALAEMAPLTPAFKLFLGGSTGLGGVLERAALRGLFEAAAATGRMVVGHCEDEELLREGKRSHPDASAAEHHLVRSEEAEVRSIETAIELASQAGSEFHVFHISTGRGVERVRAAQARGLAISASTAPHYLLLSCEDAPRLGNYLKVNPSIKTRTDGAAILGGLADGSIDAIGTDHAPHTLEEKGREYAHAPSGMPSVDLLWPLTFELVRRGLLDARVALESVTSRAAKTLHLPRKGALLAGYDGDLVLFDPTAERVVRGAELPSRSKWSAYEGLRLSGFPEIVVRRGAVAFRAGRATAEGAPGSGRPLLLAPPGVRGDRAR